MLSLSDVNSILAIQNLPVFALESNVRMPIQGWSAPIFYIDVIVLDYKQKLLNSSLVIPKLAEFALESALRMLIQCC
jgi:hypothetical protein